METDGYWADADSRIWLGWAYAFSSEREWDLSNACFSSRQLYNFHSSLPCTVINHSPSSTNTSSSTANTNSFVKWVKALMASFGTLLPLISTPFNPAHTLYVSLLVYSAAKDTESGEQVAIKKVIIVDHINHKDQYWKLLYQGLPNLWEEHPCQTCPAWSEAS